MLPPSTVIDSARRTLVRELAFLDAAQHEELLRINRLVSRLLAVPMSTVGIVVGDRNVVAAQVGLGTGSGPIDVPLADSFCQYVVSSGRGVAIDDAVAHPVVGEATAVHMFGIGAYAGMPLEVRGQVVGTLCAIDRKPRAWSRAELAILQDLAGAASSQLRGRLVGGVDPRDTVAELLRGVLAAGTDETFSRR